MSSREEILNRLRGNVRETYDFPDLGFKKLEFADPVAQYIETTTTTAGARVFEIKPTDDINAKIPMPGSLPATFRVSWPT